MVDGRIVEGGLGFGELPPHDVGRIRGRLGRVEVAGVARHDGPDSGQSHEQPAARRLVVGEGGVRPIASGDSETFAGLPPGVHLVMLKNVAPGCALEGGNPQRAVVEIGKTAAIGLVVRCGSATR